jgi:hypothetical protein
LGLPGTNAPAYFGPFVSNEEKNVCEYCHKYFIPFFLVVAIALVLKTLFLVSIVFLHKSRDATLRSWQSIMPTKLLQSVLMFAKTFHVWYSGSKTINLKFCFRLKTSMPGKNIV